MTDASTIVVALLSVIGFLYFRDRRYRNRVAEIPGPKGLPILGNIFDFIVPEDKAWDALHKFNGPYYPIHKISMIGWNVVIITRPDDAEALLTSKTNISKSAIYDVLHPWFQLGLLTSSGSKWQNRRKILTPAFHFNILRESVTVFDEEGQRMVREIKENKSDRVYDLVTIITKYTLNTICETAMGTSQSESTASNSEYRQAVHDVSPIVMHRLMRPWLHPYLLFQTTPLGRKFYKSLKIIHSFSNRIIRERKKYYDEMRGNNTQDSESSGDRSMPKKRLGMLDLLIASMKAGHIDEAGIREEVDTFIFEGHETVAMSICFTLALLAEHADIQQRARDEIDAMLEENGGKMDYNAIQRLTYLDRCVKESLRLFPSVHLISRVLDEDMYLSNYKIPKETVVHLYIYDLQRDPNFWPDPCTFDPDRFLPERIAERHPFSYIPFSAGLRNCIGQKFAMLELKAMVVHLLHNFYLEPIDLASEVTFRLDLVLRPARPLRVRFVPRQISSGQNIAPDDFDPSATLNF